MEEEEEEEESEEMTEEDSEEEEQQPIRRGRPPAAAKKAKAEAAERPPVTDKLSPIKPRKRKPVREVIDDDFSDENWAVEDEHGQSEAAAGNLPPAASGAKRSSRRAAANKSQKFIKEMAEDLAREDYEDEEDEYGVEEPIYDRRVLPKVNNGQQERKGGETTRSC